MTHKIFTTISCRMCKARQKRAKKKGEVFLEHKILALCDPEEDYAEQLSAYLQSYREFPWEVVVYTGISQLADSEKQGEIDLLLMAESIYAPQLPVEAEATVLLNESGLVRWSSLKMWTSTSPPRTY